jgi:hypothetical protein
VGTIPFFLVQLTLGFLLGAAGIFPYVSKLDDADMNPSLSNVFSALIATLIPVIDLWLMGRGFSAVAIELIALLYIGGGVASEVGMLVSGYVGWDEIPAVLIAVTTLLSFLALYAGMWNTGDFTGTKNVLMWHVSLAIISVSTYHSVTSEIEGNP